MVRFSIWTASSIRPIKIQTAHRIKPAIPLGPLRWTLTLLTICSITAAFNTTSIAKPFNLATVH
ncbi:Uncharacterised protein [Vibrio cholerae]|nr:Uncharacterised protein [Vibrio cholerae]